MAVDHIASFLAGEEDNWGGDPRVIIPSTACTGSCHMSPLLR